MKRDLGTQTVAGAYLELLALREIDYLFATAGSDFSPIIEAYAAAKRSGARVPRPVLVPHENVAVSMAYGYTMLTDRMQAVMVHVGLGTANALCGLFNASRENIPMLFSAGCTPWTEGGVPGGRDNYINWAQEMFDQGALTREVTKWNFELRHPSQMVAAVDRALALANSHPRGPVSLILPREVLAAGHDKIDRAKDDDTIVINEYPMVMEELGIRRHGAYFALSSVGALGWGMGAALGAKLARPEATVIASVGDGIYMLGNPTPFHFVSRAENLPVLTVIFNNRRWGAVHRSTLKMYPDGYAAREAEPPLSTLEPAPDYEKIVEACGGYGERVEDPAELPHALQRALHQVRDEKRQAVLNVITEINYRRTS